MTTGFDWQTEEELGENTDEPVVPVPHSRLRRFLSAFLLFLLVILLTVLLLFRQLQTQVVVPVTNQTEADVLAAHVLLLEAAKSQDIDLFQAQLSAQDETTGWWTHTRTLMMEQGNWPGWSTFGLKWEGAAAEPVITLSLDLTQATVHQKQRFHYTPGAEEAQEIILEQTYYYRFSPTGWKLTSAPADKQQAWQTHSFPLAAFIYPATETEFSLRLAKEVRDKVDQFCTLVTCDQLPLFTVYLEANPTELAPAFLSEHWSGWTVRPDLYLPSPAMLGTPLDEKGEALIRLLYTQVIISYLSSRLSQWPGPGSLLTPAQATTVWQIQSALVALEMRQPHAAAPPRSLDWQSTEWPDDPLILVCPSEQTSVYEFDAPNGTWQTLFKRPTLQEIYPAGAGLILIDEPSPGVEQASWWHDQDIQRLSPSGGEAAEIYTSAYAWATPLTNTLLLNLGNIGTETYHNFLVNTDQCDENDCVRQPLSGRPIWSPNGQRTLIRMPGHISEFYLGDAQARPLTLLGTGQDPFWVDDETVAYIRVPTLDSSVLFSPSHHLVLLNPEQPENAVRITTAQLWASLEKEPDGLMYLQEAVPNGEGQIVIDALTTEAMGRVTTAHYRFLYAPESGTLESVPIFVPGRFAPGTGQWLTVSAMTFSPLDFFTPTQGTWTIQLQQDWTGQTRTFTLPASGYLPYYLPLSPATEDGQWVALLYDQSLIVWSPIHNITYNLRTPEPNCNNVLWLAPSHP